MHFHLVHEQPPQGKMPEALDNDNYPVRNILLTVQESRALRFQYGFFHR